MGPPLTQQLVDLQNWGIRVMYLCKYDHVSKYCNTTNADSYSLLLFLCYASLSLAILRTMLYNYPSRSSENLDHFIIIYTVPYYFFQHSFNGYIIFKATKFWNQLPNDLFIYSLLALYIIILTILMMCSVAILYFLFAYV